MWFFQFQHVFLLYFDWLFWKKKLYKTGNLKYFGKLCSFSFAPFVGIIYSSQLKYLANMFVKLLANKGRKHSYNTRNETIYKQIWSLINIHSNDVQQNHYPENIDDAEVMLKVDKVILILILTCTENQQQLCYNIYWSWKITWGWEKIEKTRVKCSPIKWLTSLYLAQICSLQFDDQSLIHNTNESWLKTITKMSDEHKKNWMMNSN
jgi:hypothetical protein